MEVHRAIYERRAIRAFTPEAVDEATVRALIDAAVQAPSATNAQPWGFVVVAERELLREYAERAKAHYLTLELPGPYGSQARELLQRPGYDIFHGAPLLIVIYAASDRHDTVSDCFLAAQNLMLAAHDAGLGTCPIGFARPFFGLPDVKEALGVDMDWEPALSLVLGHPAERPEGPGRQPARMLAWRAGASTAQSSLARHGRGEQVGDDEETAVRPAGVLIVAHRTAATPKLLAAIHERAGRGPCAFTLLVPRSYWDPDTEEAAATLELAIPLLEGAAGGHVEGIVGSAEDPLAAIQDALGRGRFDEVIISTLPAHVSRWLHRDLPHRVEQLGLPVTVLTAEQSHRGFAVPPQEERGSR